MRKFIFISLGVIAVYYILSVCIGFKAGSLTQHMFYGYKIDVSNSKDEAIRKGYLIDQTTSINLKNENGKCPLTFWREKYVEQNKYGFLPIFHFKKFSSDFCILHFGIDSLEESENVLVKVNRIDGYFDFKFKKDNYIIGKISDSLELECVIQRPSQSDSNIIFLNWIK